MKNTWILSSALVAGLFAPNLQDGGDDELLAEIMELREEVNTLTERVENSERIHRETLNYLNGLANQAKKMEGTLESAESKGFTAGINPASRETLLEGWRTQLGGLQKNVPTMEPKKEEPQGRRFGQR